MDAPYGRRGRHKAQKTGTGRDVSGNCDEGKGIDMTAAGIAETSEESGTLHRSIDWKGAFWVASGVPALVLFSIGGVAGNVGELTFLVWALSMVMGFIQSFTYAEIAGLFPNKSGGASIYGAAAWLPYSKLIAPLSVWCNWFAWSPVLSLGCSIAAAYIINAYAPVPDAAIHSWSLVSYHFGPIGFS